MSAAAVVARTGRHRQRYQDNFRLVSGFGGGHPGGVIRGDSDKGQYLNRKLVRCIPYKVIEDDGNCEWLHRVKVLMVSTPNRNDLVFPKGGWEDDETVEDAACREALEEAGVRGNIKGVALGVWEFRSKSREEVSCMEGGCRGYMFPLEVVEELDVWPEQGDKSRKWLNIEEARRMCRYNWMREALDNFSELIVKELDNESLKDVAIISSDSGLSIDPSAVVTDSAIIPLNCRASPSVSHHSSPREFLGSVGLESSSLLRRFY